MEQMEEREQITKQIHSFLERHGVRRDARKKEILIRQGERGECLYLIEKGIVRGFYLDENGNEATKCFSFDGEVACTECFLKEGNASFSVECIKDCRLIEISYAELRQALKEEPEVAEVMMYFYKKAYLKIEERQRTMLMQDARERYLTFLREFGEKGRWIPAVYLASYIHVNPSTLSRIRAILRKESEERKDL